MAERKRRPPSGKVKPGTPHPTKAHTVRGFDGRWVTRKSYNAAKKAREVAKKGGSLVKRASSAVTKASKGAITKASKAGELLKIRKGDKGIVRGIKDTYKFGKDTRKSADAVYKAGQVTRKVHDKLVKGGKEFVKGTVEAGKATRRAYERLKPGGKIVKTKGSKITKYTKPSSKIVRSPGGKVVKSPGGKVVKSPGGKLAKSTSNKGGKLTTTRTPQYKTDAKKTAKQTAQQQKNTARRAERLDKAQMKKTRAAKGSGPTPGRKPIITKQTTTATKVKRFVKTNAPKVGKGIKSGGKKLSKLAAKTGILGKVAGRALMINDLAHSTADHVRDVGNVYRKTKKKPLLKRINIGGRKYGTDFTDKHVDKLNENLAKTGSYSGKTKNKKSTKENKKGLTFKNMKEKGLLDKAKPIGTYKGGAKAEPIGTAKPGEGKAVPLNKKKKPFQNRVSGGSAKPKKQIPNKKKLTSAQIEANERKAWEKKTRNSPARKSGAFTADQLWQQQKKHRKWKKRMGRN